MRVTMARIWASPLSFTVSMYRLLLPVAIIDSVVQNDDSTVTGLTPMVDELQFGSVKLLRTDELPENLHDPVRAHGFIPMRIVSSGNFPCGISSVPS